MKDIADHCERIVTRDAKQDAEKIMDVIYLAKRYLEGYKAQKQYVANLEQEIEDVYETSNKMCATYDEHIGHSSVEKLHQGARLAGDSEFQESKLNLKRARRIVEKIDKAVIQLPEVEKKIIEDRYFTPKPISWDIVSYHVGYEQSWCRRLEKRALRTVAVNLFGIEAVINLNKHKISTHFGQKP